MKDVQTRRALMVQRQIAARGVRDQAVLDAMASVPREAFLSPELAEFAYDDTPLPIPHQQTISQPYVVAFMAEALKLEGGERVLEIGTGSGYSAAVLACIAREVYSIERHAELADQARRRLARLGYTNVRVLHGDGTLGWPEYAPYDGIVVTAGGPAVPQALVDQLAPGGRLVIPVGREPTEQTLVRVTRLEGGRVREEDLGGVRFVPLIGVQGWPGGGGGGRDPPVAPHAGSGERELGLLVRECAEPIRDLADVELGPFLERVGESRVVLLGASTQGTSQFLSLRALLTRALIERCGFRVVALEADGSDAACLDHFVRGTERVHATREEAFTCFPAWTWRNRETLAWIEWLREHNAGRASDARVAVHGLDLYGLESSTRQVLDYLDAVDPRAAHTARERYGCLSPWETDPTTYGRAASHGLFRSCEHEVVAMLTDLLARRGEGAGSGGEPFLDGSRLASLVAGAERHYRALYHGGNAAWDLRTSHMHATLLDLLAHHGPEARVVVWGHNAQVGDARATEPGAHGRLGLGQLVRESLGEGCYLVGQATDRGTLVAARAWDGPADVRRLRGAPPGSHEHVLRESGLAACLLPLAGAGRTELVQELSQPRLERAIGVVYRPRTELDSHCFPAVLPRQFDEVVWVETTSALRPLTPREERALAPSHPFSRLTAEMVG